MAAPWLPSSQSGRLSFFDLAAETRNQIYHHLFDGQLIHIREKDDGDEIEEQPEDWPNKPHGVPPKWLIIRRNKAMGLNLLLASKQWLAEAKPILLNSATFDIKVDSWAEASPVKGFSIHDLRNTRFLRYQTNAQHIGELAYAASSICQSSLATVTGLCKVEIYSSRTLTLPYKSYGLDTLDVSLKDPVILELLHRAFLKPGSEYKAAFDHMQKRAKTDHAEAILKQCLYLKGSRTYLCIELLSHTFWLEGLEEVKGLSRSRYCGMDKEKTVAVITPRQPGPSPQRLLEMRNPESVWSAMRQPIIWEVRRPLRKKRISCIKIINGEEWTVVRSVWR